MNEPKKKEENNLTIVERDVIFKKLVLEDTKSQTNYGRIVGMIAHCQYLIQKYQYLEKSKLDHGNYPSDSEIEALIKYFSGGGDAIESLKKTSELQLKECIKDFINKETEDMLKLGQSNFQFYLLSNHWSNYLFRNC